ncbi:hypothetical protein [Mariniblastus fucicola]|nr:hypothetical protein [Mariniblastus fucicola]
MTRTSWWKGSFVMPTGYHAQMAFARCEIDSDCKKGLGDACSNDVVALNDDSSASGGDLRFE